MAMLSDFRLDLALRYATLYCFKEDIEYIDSLKREDITVSPKTKRKVMRQWDREQREPRFRVPKYLKTAAVAILLSISILFGVAMCIEPVRAAFIEAVVTWYEDYFLVSFRKSQVETEFVPMEPTYIPDGFELTEHYETDNLLFLSYICNNQYLFFEQYNDININLFNDNTEWILSDNSLMNKNGVTIKCYISDKCSLVTWRDKYLYKIIYNIENDDEIIKLINSVKPKK